MATIFGPDGFTDLLVTFYFSIAMGNMIVEVIILSTKENISNTQDVQRPSAHLWLTWFWG